MNCILFAQRDIETELDHGHCCDKCRTRIRRDLSDILRCVDLAAEHVQPGRGTSGGSGKPVFESRVPVNVDAIDPELARMSVMPGITAPTDVLELCELWERMIREMRGYAAYGLASDLRLKASQRPARMKVPKRPLVGPLREHEPRPAVAMRSLPQPARTVTEATLVGVVSFLLTQVEWACEDPTFPLEDFASEVHSAWATVRHWGSDGGDSGTIVICPTLTDDGTCGTKLRVSIFAEIEGRDDHRQSVWCKGCGAVRKPDQLLAASGAEDAYLPAAMIAEHLEVAEGTIRSWAKDGRVKRDGRRYRFGDVRRLVIERMTRRNGTGAA